jgi:hypothetical protein
MIQFINEYIRAAVGAYEFNGFAVIPFILIPIILCLPVVYLVLYVGAIKARKG